jgi:asparagine synthase (glutamine-hydrolysing)
MRLIGGLAHHDPAEPAAPPVLRAIAAAVAGVSADSFVAQGSIGFVSSLGRPSLETNERILVVADADLVNLEELQAATGGAIAPGRLLSTLYEREGPRFVRRLRGAFALALWDQRERILLLAVDHFGIRRLFYATDQRCTAFASRPSALLAVPGLERAVDLTAVYNYLNFGYVPAPGAPFRGMRRLPPGHLLTVRDGQARLEQYWDMAYEERPLRESDAAATLYRATERAVGTSLSSLAPKEVGAFLSGGTDSSTVVGLMSRVSGEKVSAFSMGFAEEPYDELAYAELAARHFDASHYTHVVDANEAFALLPRLVEAYDEPFGNNSAIGTFCCAQVARDCGVRTLLAGDGGDEIFGGNERYASDRIFARYHRIPRVVRRGLIEPVLRALPSDAPGVLGRAQRYVRRANLPNPRRFYSYSFHFAQDAAVFTPDFRTAVDVKAPYEVIETHFARARAAAELDRQLYLDLKLTIGDNDLLKVTRTCELAGVDVRFPFLDLSLVELTGTWPSRFKLRGLEKRHLFKRAFRELLPPEILAKRKHGFGVPTSDWIKTDPRFTALARETLLGSRCRQRGYFRSGALEQLFLLHLGESTPYYGDILWTVLMLELWHQRHVDRPTERIA